MNKDFSEKMGLDQNIRKGCYVGIDVGTQSARAALVSERGEILASASHPLKIWNPAPDIYVQSSSNIWEACCQCLKKLGETNDLSAVRGLGFDATCSLVVVGTEGQPISVDPISRDDERNIILWMDHRAAAEAQKISATGHRLLKYVGNTISLEMQPPKLLWLKKNMPETWQKARHFFDLPDFLTWKATGCLSRSVCSLTCKWLYPSASDDLTEWDNFWNLIGLSDLCQDNHAKIGSHVIYPGQSCGSGLSLEAAQELSLHPGIAVAGSMIDAYAGTLGMLGCQASVPTQLLSRMVIVSGTSNCHMLVGDKEIVSLGVWGPYWGALLPHYWMMEAGQSAAGALVDHVIQSHTAFATLNEQAQQEGRHIQEVLNALLLKVAKDKTSISALATNLHVWPDFHGNRTPLADPSLRGMISGMTLSMSKENLASVYLATLQSLAYSTRHIIESIAKSGHAAVKSLLICGGLAKNQLYLQLHADITGLPVVTAHCKEPVLLGAAMLAAVACQDFPTLESAMNDLASSGTVIHPIASTKQFHDKKYQAFHCLLECQLKCQRIMAE